MKLSDTEFNDQLDDFVATTVKFVDENQPTDYEPMALLVYEDKLKIEALVNLGEPAREDVDLYELFYEFGLHLAQEEPVPQAVFAAARFLWLDDSPCIFISGCSADG